MTIADLHDIISTLPDTMPIAVRGYEIGWDPATSVHVSALVPNKKIHWYEGVLTKESVSDVAPRNSLVFLCESQMSKEVLHRLEAAGINGVYNQDRQRWLSLGWMEQHANQIPLPFPQSPEFTNVVNLCQPPSPSNDLVF